MRTSDKNIDRVYCNVLSRDAGYIMNKSHSHDYYELFYVKQGLCHFFVNNQVCPLSAGDFLLIPPHIMHYNQYPAQSTRYNIYFYRRDLIEDRTVNPIMISNWLKLGVWHTPGAHRSIIESTLESMVSDEKLNDNLTKDLVWLKLNQLLLYTTRYCIRKPPEHPESELRENDPVIEDATQYIATHFNQPITLEKLAKKAGLSPTYFSKKFRKSTGTGLKEFIIYVRLQNAALELKSTRHSITDVALNCGFNDSNYFKDSFKKMFGMPPREYRKSHETDLLLNESIVNTDSSLRKGITIESTKKCE